MMTFFLQAVFFLVDFFFQDFVSVIPQGGSAFNHVLIANDENKGFTYVVSSRKDG